MEGTSNLSELSHRQSDPIYSSLKRLPNRPNKFLYPKDPSSEIPKVIKQRILDLRSECVEGAQRAVAFNRRKFDTNNPNRTGGKKSFKIVMTRGQMDAEEKKKEEESDEDMENVEEIDDIQEGEENVEEFGVDDIDFDKLVITKKKHKIPGILQSSRGIKKLKKYKQPTRKKKSYNLTHFV